MFHSSSSAEYLFHSSYANGFKIWMSEPLPQPLDQFFKCMWKEVNKISVILSLYMIFKWLTIFMYLILFLCIKGRI